MWVWSGGKWWELALSSHHVGSGVQTQGARLGSKCYLDPRYQASYNFPVVFWLDLISGKANLNWFLKFLCEIWIHRSVDCVKPEPL